MKVNVSEEMELVADTDGERETWSKLDAAAFSQGVDIISDYNTYKDFLNRYSNEEDVNYMDIYAEEFFENNSLLIVEHDEYRSGMIDISYSSMEMVDDACEIKLIAFVPEEGTDDSAYWGIMIPVEGKDWMNKSYTVTKTDMILNE